MPSSCRKEGAGRRGAQAEGTCPQRGAASEQSVPGTADSRQAVPGGSGSAQGRAGQEQGSAHRSLRGQSRLRAQPHSRGVRREGLVPRAELWAGPPGKAGRSGPHGGSSPGARGGEEPGSLGPQKGLEGRTLPLSARCFLLPDVGVASGGVAGRPLLRGPRGGWGGAPGAELGAGSVHSRVGPVRLRGWVF